VLSEYFRALKAGPFTSLAIRRMPPSQTYWYTCKNMSRDSSVGTATGYGPDDRMTGVRFPAGARNFSLRHHVQNGSGAHPASYPMGTRDSFPGGRATAA
jgi:hypothetical protein